MHSSWVSKTLRWSAIFLGVSNTLIIILGIILMFGADPPCRKGDIAPFLAIVLVSCLRIPAMLCTAIAQRAMATIILDSQSETETHVVDAATVRRERRKRYKRWVWCTRFAVTITVVQILDTVYLLVNVTKSIHQERASSNCVLGLALCGTKEKLKTLVLFLVIVCCTTMVQCCAGSDVLRWRSFYATEGNLWKAHYQEVFDHGIREAFCCLGRVKYLDALEEDEIYSVAQLLGDLVTYRATGTGHLELLAGLALLKKCKPFSQSHEELLGIPTERVHEAAVFHQFAEATYTGLLLDVGRYPLMFPCAWLYRQGIFSLWSRNRRPAVEGDNWWRGHAAAFLKHVKLNPDALRKGRVNQGKCKASYFMVVLHQLKSVVIAVRGTETPEDLITDGLCRECSLSKDDLDGLISDGTTMTMVSSLSYYGHSGVIEAAQDLYIQIEGNSTRGGYLSSLLGEGCECEGYNLRIVGHSLGGAIAALLGFRLYRRYPKLHVYAYGPLPCLDLVAADACSNFVTSVILNNEFSARLSVASIMRLRAAAIDALSQDSIARSAIVSLAQRYFFLNGFIAKDNKMLKEVSDFSLLSKVEAKTAQTMRQTHQYGRGEEDLESCWEEIGKEDSSKLEISSTDSKPNCDDLFSSSPNVSHYDDQLFKLTAALPSSEILSSLNVPEMFVPGLVVHIVPVKEHVHHPLLKRWSTWEEDCSYKAYVAKRESFKDIIVSPSMFLDHLPWRCYRAIKKVLDRENLCSASSITHDRFFLADYFLDVGSSVRINAMGVWRSIVNNELLTEEYKLYQDDPDT